ncbi:MAG: SDR family NAD(P)-dependent oxidoreductase [Pseudomonadota bacterium]
MKLNNRTIVLTGPSSGVGLDLLKQLATHNRVIGLSRRRPPDEAIEALTHYTHITLDLAEADSVAEAIATIRGSHPDGIDGLINCGAVQFTARFVDEHFEPESIAREIAINLASPAQLIAGLIDPLSRTPSPFIMNINSGLGLVPKHESAIYCATKAALDNLTRGLRPQLKAKGIAVQQAFLPLVDTPMTEGRGSGKLTSGDVAAQIIRAIETRTLDTDIGKVKLLRSIQRLSPSLAHRIMQKGDA